MGGLPGPGQLFANYEIVRQVGKGSMGVVFEATHRDLRRSVALKLLSPDLAEDADYRARFIREAQALARLDSPRIVTVFDAGEYDGWLYIATQYLPEGSLQSVLAQHGPLSQADAVEFAAQIAEGLAAAHGAGIVHRDIKPSNILLKRDSAGGLQALIADFGISRLLDSEATRTVGIIGTLGYMAPERHNGEEATESADIYAVGCLLWALLTGKAPWVGTDIQVGMGHLSQPVPQLVTGDPSTGELNAIIRRAMAKDPRERYPDAAALESALRALLLEQRAVSAQWAAALEPTILKPSMGTTAPNQTSENTEPGHDADKPDQTSEMQARVPAPDRRWLPVVAASLGVLLLLVSGYLWLSSRDRDGAPSAATTGGASPSDEGKTSGRPSGVASTPNASSGDRKERFTCWEGTRVERMAQCPDLAGNAGLRWVFPSLDDIFPRCVLGGGHTPGRILMYECPFTAPGGAEGKLRYSAWDSARTARRHYRASYPGVPDRLLMVSDAPAQVYWRLDTARDDGLFRMSAAYVKWPYSFSVDAPTPSSLDYGIALVRSRPADGMLGKPS